jgi:hypothetical protein
MIPDDLFTVFERRPDQCSAVLVREENIDRLAQYYAFQGYVTEVVRDPETGASLTLARDGVRVRVSQGECLVYGNPPSVEVAGPFQREWRRAPKEAT